MHDQITYKHTNYINTTQNQKIVKTGRDMNFKNWQPVINLFTVTVQQQLFEWIHVAMFPKGLLDVQDKFQPNLVTNKWLVRFRIHIQGITKCWN